MEFKTLLKNAQEQNKIFDGWWWWFGLGILLFVFSGLLWYQQIEKSSIIRIDGEICSPTQDGSRLADCASKVEEEVPISLDTGSENNNSQLVDQVLVDVSGAVSEPGVYYLNVGARMSEAIVLAGGILEHQADMEWVQKSLNLAQRLEDGEKIYIPFEGEAESRDDNSSDKKIGKVGINKATKEELIQLPGVGEGLATKILEYRDQHGEFKTIDELKDVPGVGEGVMREISQKIVL